MHMHDLVDDLEQRLVVVNLAVMHFLWLAPAAIKQNLGRHNPHPDPLPQGRTGYAGATVVIVPFDPRYLSSPSSTYNIPPPAGFTDGGTDALAIAITPCPAPNWLVVLKPMLPPAASR